MQWTQYDTVDGIPERFSRYKCNLCGATQKVAATATGGPALPDGWSAAAREGWHYCPTCHQRPPRNRRLLPVVNG